MSTSLTHILQYILNFLFPDHLFIIPMTSVNALNFLYYFYTVHLPTHLETQANQAETLSGLYELIKAPSGA